MRWRDHAVTVAAEALGETQAAVNGSLTRLRVEHDDKLFVLVGREMESTPLACELTPHLLDSLATVRRTHAVHAYFDPATAKRLFKAPTWDIGEAVFWFFCALS
jgi:DNA-binding transcriptional LysR family regulator